MRDVEKICKIAAIQAVPVMLDKDACTQKIVDLIQEAPRRGAQLMVFLELFIPGYPYGMTFGFRVGSRSGEGRQNRKLCLDNSTLVPGKEIEEIDMAAREAGAYISTGVSERDEVTGMLYNTNLFFSPRGSLVCVYRKLKPTGAERVVWGDADWGYSPAEDTPWGVMGSLICWESYMSLTRAALYERGTALYISSNINDNPKWQSTIQHIAPEGRCYFINCNMHITRDMYPEGLRCRDEVDGLPDTVCRGDSCTVGPYGHYVTESVWDKETIIYADLEMGKVSASRMEFDVCNHYSRPDVLRLQIDDR